MKLLVDIIPYDRGRSGISAYARHVVKELVAQGHDVTLVTEPGVAAEFFPGFSAIEAPGWTRRAVFSMLWHLFCLPRKIKKSGCVACLLLAANRRILRSFPLPTVAVVHDLSQYHVEAKYDAARMFYIKRVLPHYVRRAPRVVAISKSTAADLVKYWKIPEEKISVVYDGFTPPPLQSEVGTLRTAILYISRLEHPGKNHVRLIEAYGRLPRELASRHPLVLVGADWNGADAVHAAAEASPYRDLIQFRGFVSNEEMPRLWGEAAAYVFPSLFEGFGLSLLEAMAAGVPCACSRTSSLGELGEGVAELFDPESVDEIAASLSRLLTSDNTARIAAGRARASSFSWSRCARELLASFPKAEVFGVPLACVTMSEALSTLISASTSSLPPLTSNLSPAPSLFCFANAHALNIAYKDEAFAEILRNADAVWPDGTGVRMAGRHLGFPVPENVNGTDMFPLLCQRAAKEGVSLFLYGARPGVAEAAAAKAQADCPGLRIAGVCDGYVSDAEAIEKINAVRPDIVLVAKGMPIQEKWMATHRKDLSCRAIVAVGGLFDFVSARIPRAPKIMRRLGIEWLFRLACEPRRMFCRYVLGNPLFIARLKFGRK